MADSEYLRPLERRVLRLRAEGQDDAEIGRRFHRSPEHIRRVADLARIARHPSADRREAGERVDRREAGQPDLRPLERRVLAWREDGATPEEIAPRFKHSPEHMARVEDLARYKLRRQGR
jgi:DNA-binding CsgD family transcriptional regulator